MGCAKEPVVCCSGGTPPQRKDECTCGMICLNGPIQIAAVQILLFIGWMFSMATLGDCRFVTIPGGFFPLLENSTGVGPRRGIGLFVFEDPFDGQCFWYNENLGFLVDEEEIFDNYQTFLGNDWRVSQFVGSAAAILSFYTWIYVLSYTCSSHVRAFRYAAALMLSVACVIVQSLTFLVLSHGFCDQWNCNFGRSAGFGIGAIVAFFLAGIAMFLTKDYPGDLLGMEAVATTTNKGAEDEDEEFYDVREDGQAAAADGAEEDVDGDFDDDHEDPTPAANTITPRSNIEGFDDEENNQQPRKRSAAELADSNISLQSKGIFFVNDNPEELEVVDTKA